MFKKLESQLLFITIVPLLLMIISTLGFYLADSLEDADTAIETKGNYISEQALLLSEFHFFTGNIEEIEKIGELLFQTEGLDFIIFFDDRKYPLASFKKSNISDSKVFEITVFNKNVNIEDFETLNDETTENDLLGYISIGLSNSELQEKKLSIYRKIISVSLFTILFGLVLIYAFSRKLSKSLNSLKETAILIEKNNLDKRCDENGSGEILKIQKVFNNMAESIQHNERDLQNKVEDATKALSQTVSELSAKNEELDSTRKKAIELERSKAISEERSRIMKDMHDGIGGHLVASLALIEREKDTYIRNNVSEILSSCLDDFRLIINSINPRSNDLLSLLADFKYRISRKLESLNVHLNWSLGDFKHDYYIQPQQGLHILRILQESFSNVLKHANANIIYFSIDEYEDYILMRVEDDGQFTHKETDFGQGITNMQWRAKQLNSEFSIEKNNLGGCLVKLKINKKILPKEPLGGSI